MVLRRRHGAGRDDAGQFGDENLAGGLLTPFLVLLAYLA
jgi:hypothetical protein